MTQMLRIKSVFAKTGKNRSSLYKDISAGLWTAGVRLGPRAVAWPEHEIDAIIKARIAGKSEDAIRALVCKLNQDRVAQAEAL